MIKKSILLKLFTLRRPDDRHTNPCPPFILRVHKHTHIYKKQILILKTLGNATFFKLRTSDFF